MPHFPSPLARLRHGPAHTVPPLEEPVPPGIPPDLPPIEEPPPPPVEPPEVRAAMLAR